MNPSSSFFITGTDTEVGKTLVSGALILKLREIGKDTIGFKPVVAGTYSGDEGQLFNEDLETLRIAANLPLGQLSLCPYVLDTPAAPHLVAKAKRAPLELEIMMKAYNDLHLEKGSVVVEGAGGFLVPLNDHEDLSDFAQHIHLPVILVVGMKLGCINHALLTIEALRARKLVIAGWIANTLDKEMGLLSENIETLRTRIDQPFLGLIPTLPSNIQKLNNQPYSIEALKFAAQHIQLPS
jgi:dethiobiotin synthetase